LGLVDLESYRNGDGVDLSCDDLGQNGSCEVKRKDFFSFATRQERDNYQRWPLLRDLEAIFSLRSKIVGWQVWLWQEVDVARIR